MGMPQLVVTESLPTKEKSETLMALLTDASALDPVQVETCRRTLQCLKSQESQGDVAIGGKIPILPHKQTAPLVMNKIGSSSTDDEKSSASKDKKKANKKSYKKNKSTYNREKEIRNGKPRWSDRHTQTPQSRKVR